MSFNIKHGDSVNQKMCEASSERIEEKIEISNNFTFECLIFLWLNSHIHGVVFLLTLTERRSTFV
jgi:hypothetical protein